MRLEVQPASPPASAQATVAPGVDQRRRRSRRLDPVEGAILVLFAAVSCWVLGLDLYQVVANGRIWTGTDGTFISDQMQYLAWIQSASQHGGLVSNLFVLHGTPADYFQPAVAISGGLTALGIAPWLVLLLWKPVAVLATFFGIRAYAHRSLTGVNARRVVIALALFYGSITTTGHGSWGPIGDLFPGFLSWGYSFGLIGLGLALYALVVYDRARRAARVSWVPALLGALASSLHPWQGEELILVVLAAEVLRLRSDGLRRRHVQLAAITLIGTLLPLLYYLLLGKLDPSWAAARVASKHTYPLVTILLALVPLAPFALLGLRGRSTGFWQTSVRVFPLAILADYLISASGASATPLHAFQGVTIPMAVLAVEGALSVPWARLPRRRLLRHWRVAVVVGLALVTIPATVWELRLAPEFMGPSSNNANYISPSERDALDFLAADRQPGGVLTREYLGIAVPAETGRNTYVGDCLWSEPNCSRRSQLTNELAFGQLSPSAARAFVLGTRARFVLTDCKTRSAAARSLVASELTSISVRVRHFGCADLYEIATGQGAAPAS